MSFTGWYPKRHYPINRPLTEEEKQEKLEPHSRPLGDIPYPGLNILRANGTFIECAERSQGMRGSFIVLMLTIASLNVYFMFGYLTLYDSLAGAIADAFSPTDTVNWGG